MTDKQFMTVPALDEPETTPDEARRFLRKIRAGKFQVQRETKEKLISQGNLDVLEQLEELAKNGRSLYRKNLQSVIDEVYHDSSRVLYELIQNADDAEYSKAWREGNSPFMRFTFDQQDLVIDTNEDGFTRANVEAICSLRESSKKHPSSDNSTGEKGIGFKSVFLICDNVHIQSGVWSFSFEQDEDNFLSTVIPIDTEPRQIPENVGTRIRLRYRQSCRNDILRYLAEIPSETILFLRKLQQISIQFDETCIPNSSPTSRIITRKTQFCAVQDPQRFPPIKQTNEMEAGNEYRCPVCPIAHVPRHGAAFCDHANVVHIHTSSTIREKVQRSQTHYRLSRIAFTDMPTTKGRPTVGADTEMKVELAFPINEDGTHPKTSKGGANVCAFLPMCRQENLPFSIQSDFLTMQNRQDVVDCPWNRVLREQTANAFQDTVVKFCKEESFRFSWPQYLPQERLNGNFWESFRALLVEKLRTTEILQCWDDDQLYCPGDLAILPNYFLYGEKREPLFKDLVDKIYLSRHYHEERVLEHLRTLGVRELSPDEIVERIEFDLELPNSVLREKYLQTDWHDCMCEAIKAILKGSIEHTNSENSSGSDDQNDTLSSDEGSSDDSGNTNPTTIHARLKALNIILLRDGSWVNLEEEIYFPTIGGFSIPDGLGLKLLHPDVCESHTQREFYENTLGILWCEAELVIKKIMEAHASTTESYTTSDDCEPYISHFHFLFHFRGQVANEDLKSLYAVTSEGTVRRCSDGLYFGSTKPYDTQKILEALSPSYEIDCDIILHDIYNRHVDDYTNETWKQWLQDVFLIAYYPPLGEAGGTKVSTLLEYLWRLDTSLFLGALQDHWASSYEQELDDHPNIRDILHRAPMSCHDHQKHPLNCTYFPEDELLRMSEELSVTSHMPIICLPRSDEALSHRNWDFLSKLGIRRGDQKLNFCLDALLALHKRSQSEDKPTYSSIRQVFETIGREASYRDAENLRKFFSLHPCICNPTDTSDWRFSRDCVWDGPDFLTCKLPLKCHYENSTEMEILFSKYMKLGNADWKDVASELENIKRSGKWEQTSNSTHQNRSLSLSSRIYNELHARAVAENDELALRTFCEKEELVFTERGWRAPSQCVWESKYRLPGLPGLQHDYPELKCFFVDLLGVPTVNISILLHGLIDLVQAQEPSYSDVKSMLLALGPMFNAEAAPERSFTMGLATLRKYSFLPVRLKDKAPVLQKMATRFFIADHERYGQAFEKKVELLDFTLEEFRLLKSFFRKLNLENRYLSACVTEASEVPKPSVASKDFARMQDFKKRAYFFSCPKYFNFDDSTHSKLLGIEVYTCAELQTMLTLHYGNEPLDPIQSDRIQPMFTEVNDGIQIYLPTQMSELRRCYMVELPESMLKLLGIEDQRAGHCLYFLLTEKLENLHDVLKQQDIPELTWLNPIIDGDTDELTYEMGDLGLSDANRGMERTGAMQELDLKDTRHEYNRLLEHLVRQVRKKTRTVAEEFRPFRTRDTFGTPQTNPDFWDRIGVAGELFVYELLLSLDLPGFRTADHRNWRSTIRKHVRAIHEYQNLLEYDGPDMDIVYKDTTGKFSTWLKENGWGESPGFIDAAPPVTPTSPITYYIEVKSTPGPCGKPMKMSNAQYQRMHDYRIPERGWASRTTERKVFVLWRVFDLLGQNAQYAAFVDPARLDGTILKFVADRWQVTANLDG
ncbi:uncharacterized protein PV07_07832 [Cladophialophora immunda]|uniref:Sacsin/Nov domain-containing protein n=1 Tax=Cladophialophora immunda TaxID=569365 RepID=A0A0D2CCV0_9EURO|nr:uncharacterized protein PV07_07832 [Cladophialophora immunda]KIW28150.1 hypothetical protein PV07_07832 [Cladophialophora immunda]